jgi:hypothetical protein
MPDNDNNHPVDMDERELTLEAMARGGALSRCRQGARFARGLAHLVPALLVGRRSPALRLSARRARSRMPRGRAGVVWIGLGFLAQLVMAGLVPAIHVFLDLSAVRHGCPAQGRA